MALDNLYKFCRVGPFPEPHFFVKRCGGEDHTPEWDVGCTIGRRKWRTKCIGSKREAQYKVAEMALRDLKGGTKKRPAKRPGILSARVVATKEHATVLAVDGYSGTLKLTGELRQLAGSGRIVLRVEKPNK